MNEVALVMVQGPKGVLPGALARLTRLVGVEVAKTLGEVIDKIKNSTKKIEMEEVHLTTWISFDV